MDITFNKPSLNVCLEAFEGIDAEERLFMNQYDLEKHTGISSELWKEFLSDKQVIDWFRKELQVFKSAQMRKLIKNADNNERSVGAAQMLNAITKVCEDDDAKEGDLIIYSYVPLNSREQQAPNIEINTDNILE